MPRPKKHPAQRAAERLMKLAEENVTQVARMVNKKGQSLTFTTLVDTQPEKFFSLLRLVGETPLSKSLYNCAQVVEGVFRTEEEYVERILDWLEEKDATPSSFFELAALIISWGITNWDENLTKIYIPDNEDREAKEFSVYSNYVEELRLRSLDEDQQEIWDLALQENDNLWWIIHNKLAAILRGFVRCHIDGESLETILEEEKEKVKERTERPEITKIEEDKQEVEVLDIQDLDEDVEEIDETDNEEIEVEGELFESFGE